MVPARGAEDYVVGGKGTYEISSPTFAPTRLNLDLRVEQSQRMRRRFIVRNWLLIVPLLCCESASLETATNALRREWVLRCIANRRMRIRARAESAKAINLG